MPAKPCELARQICLELIVHSRIEEEIFLLLVKDEVENESYVEHYGAKIIIAKIMASDYGDAFYYAKVKVLSEVIKHYFHEEEIRVEDMLP